MKVTYCSFKKFHMLFWMQLSFLTFILLLLNKIFWIVWPLMWVLYFEQYKKKKTKMWIRHNIFVLRKIRCFIMECKHNLSADPRLEIWIKTHSKFTYNDRRDMEGNLEQNVLLTPTFDSLQTNILKTSNFIKLFVVAYILHFFSN